MGKIREATIKALEASDAPNDVQKRTDALQHSCTAIIAALEIPPPLLEHYVTEPLSFVGEQLTKFLDEVENLLLSVKFPADTAKRLCSSLREKIEEDAFTAPPIRKELESQLGLLRIYVCDESNRLIAAISRDPGIGRDVAWAVGSLAVIAAAITVQAPWGPAAAGVAGSIFATKVQEIDKKLKPLGGNQLQIRISQR